MVAHILAMFGVTSGPDVRSSAALSLALGCLSQSSAAVSIHLDLLVMSGQTRRKLTFGGLLRYMTFLVRSH